GGNGADVEKALLGSEVRLAQEYRTEVQTHSAIETHGVVADWRDDGVTLYASTQGIHSVQEEIATLFQLPKSKVRVICEFAGAGCAAGAGFAGPVKNLYPAAAVRSEENDVFLHTGPAAAFRAPGHPQGAFALEQALDELAEKLGMDPIALRDRNDKHPARREERRVGAAKFGWAEARARKSSGAVRRGVGFAQGLWYNFDGPPSNAEVLV